MDLSKLPIFAAVSKRMAWLNRRQEVLSQNIANADTPGYKPLDLAKGSFDRMLKAATRYNDLGITKTSSAHLSGLRQNRELRADTARDQFEATPTGNAVVLEDQLMKVNETQSAYRLVTNLYAKNVKLLKIAIGTDR